MNLTHCFGLICVKNNGNMQIVACNTNIVCLDSYGSPCRKSNLFIIPRFPRYLSFKKEICKVRARLCRLDIAFYQLGCVSEASKVYLIRKHLANTPEVSLIRNQSLIRHSLSRLSKMSPKLVKKAKNVVSAPPSK